MFFCFFFFLSIKIKSVFLNTRTHKYDHLSAVTRLPAVLFLLNPLYRVSPSVEAQIETHKKKNDEKTFGSSMEGPRCPLRYASKQQNKEKRFSRVRVTGQDAGFLTTGGFCSWGVIPDARRTPLRRWPSPSCRGQCTSHGQSQKVTSRLLQPQSGPHSLL